MRPRARNAEPRSVGMTHPSCGIWFWMMTKDSLPSVHAADRAASAAVMQARRWRRCMEDLRESIVSKALRGGQDLTQPRDLERQRPRAARPLDRDEAHLRAGALLVDRDAAEDVRPEPGIEPGVEAGAREAGGDRALEIRRGQAEGGRHPAGGDQAERDRLAVQQRAVAGRRLD